MTKEFIPYEQALALKELGFDESCFGYYNVSWSKKNKLLFPQYTGELENWNNNQHLCSAPLYQQAFRWFREEYDLVAIIDYYYAYKYGFHIFEFTDLKLTPNQIVNDNNKKRTYEEAELECLKQLIKIVKDENNNYI